MIALDDVRVHVAAPDDAGLHTVLVVARGRATEPGVSVSLSVELRTAQDHLVATVELPEQPVPTHPSLLEWSAQPVLPLQAVRARWVAHARRAWTAPRARVDLGGAAPSAPAPEAAPLQVAPREVLPQAPVPPAPPPVDRFAQAIVEPWEDVADLFPADSLGIDGRDRVRAMLKSEHPPEVVAACRISTATGWRTTVQPMRRLLEHPDASVREVAALGIGALAGPAMEHLLRKRVESDPDPAVRAAAAEGIAAINARLRR